jgi:hypothetical protein
MTDSQTEGSTPPPARGNWPAPADASTGHTSAACGWDRTNARSRLHDGNDARHIERQRRFRTQRGIEDCEKDDGGQQQRQVERREPAAIEIGHADGRRQEEAE